MSGGRGAILLFHGAPGSGKSTLCKAVLRKLLILLPAEVVERIEFDELYVNFAQETEFNTVTWKLARKTALDHLNELITHHNAEHGGVTSSQKKLFVLVDDTFHLPSMRKVFCRVAQTNNLAFRQFTILTELAICMRRSLMGDRHSFVTTTIECTAHYPEVPESVVRGHSHLIEKCRGLRQMWFGDGGEGPLVKPVNPDNVKLSGAAVEKWERSEDVTSWVVDGHAPFEATASAIVAIITHDQETTPKLTVKSVGSVVPRRDPVQQFEVDLRRTISEVMRFLDSPDEKREVAAISGRLKTMALHDFRQRLNSEGFSYDLNQGCLEEFIEKMKAGAFAKKCSSKGDDLFVCTGAPSDTSHL